MSNNTTKFIFLFAVIGAVLFSRTAYPNFSVLPSLSANESQSVSSANPSIVVLHTATGTGSSDLALAAQSSPDVGVSVTNTPLGYVVGGSTQEFSKIASTTPPALGDAAVLAADLTDGSALLSTNVNARWPMASLSKLMTAVVAFDDGNLNQTVTVTPQMFVTDPQEYTLQIGGTYTVSDLLRVLLLPSSNVAAEAIAGAYGRTQFIAAMNAKAQAWGMTNTYYDDPSGLSAADQSTAQDLLTLAQHIYNEYPQLLAITRNQEVFITNIATGQKVPVKSIDNFAGSADFIGGKTGHTNEANGNLFTIFNYYGHPLFILVLGTSDRFGDTQKLYDWVKTDFK